MILVTVHSIAIEEHIFHIFKKSYSAHNIVPPIKHYGVWSTEGSETQEKFQVPAKFQYVKCKKHFRQMKFHATLLKLQLCFYTNRPYMRLIYQHQLELSHRQQLSIEPLIIKIGPKLKKVPCTSQQAYRQYEQISHLFSPLLAAFSVYVALPRTICYVSNNVMVNNIQRLCLL